MKLPTNRCNGLVSSLLTPLLWACLPLLLVACSNNSAPEEVQQPVVDSTQAARNDSTRAHVPTQSNSAGLNWTRTALAARHHGCKAFRMHGPVRKVTLVAAAIGAPYVDTVFWQFNPNGSLQYQLHVDPTNGWTVEHYMDQNGRLMKEQHLDASGNKRHFCEYTYERGVLASKVKREAGFQLEAEHYTYAPELGAVTVKSTYYGVRPPDKQEVYYYNDADQLARVEEHQGEYRATLQYVFTNNRPSARYTISEGDTIRSMKYTYHPDGMEHEAWFYNTSSHYGKRFTNYKVDAHGNWLERHKTLFGTQMGEGTQKRWIEYWE